MSARGSALIAGFADPAETVAGLCWELAGSSGGVLLADGAVAGAELELDRSQHAVSLRLTAAEASCEAELPTGAATTLEGSGDTPFPAGPFTAAAGPATVRFPHRGRQRSLSCPAHLSTWRSISLDGAEALRHLALPLGGEGLILALAWRPRGAEGHGGESTAAWELGPDTALPFGEVLISTEYDAMGRQVRAGLELWPGEEESPPMRAAATAIGGVAANGFSAALLRGASEGRSGIGSYLIWRR